MQSQLRRGLIYAALGCWSLVCLFPLYWLAITSVKGADAIMRGPRYLPFFDFTPTLESWVFIFSYPNENVVNGFFNSLIVSVAATLVTVLFGSMLVYGVTRFRFRFSDPLVLVSLSTRLLPPVIVVLPLYFFAQSTGTYDSRSLLVFVYAAINLPVAIWLLLPVFGPRAFEQEEAAQLDGASRFNIYFTIFLPMVMGSLAAVGLLIFILCWNEYLFAAYLTSDHALTLPPFLVGQMSIKEAQTGGEAEEWAQFSAATVVMVVPLLVFAGLAQKYLGKLVLAKRNRF